MPDMIKSRIGDIARKRGIESGYELHRVLEVPPNMAYKFWRNQETMITYETLSKICQRLKCKPKDVLLFEPGPDETGNGYVKQPRGRPRTKPAKPAARARRK